MRRDGLAHTPPCGEIRVSEHCPGVLLLRLFIHKRPDLLGNEGPKEARIECGGTLTGIFQVWQGKRIDYTIHDGIYSIFIVPV